MNKILTAFIFLFGSISTFAQQKDNSLNNELKFNVPMAIYGLPEVSYERIVEDNMGVGISLSIAVDKSYNYDNGKGINERAIVCPYYRLYFGQKKAAGFYIEGNMAIARQKELNTPDYTTGNKIATTTTTGFGFGAALGIKLLTKNNFTGDFYAGWGRLFGENIYNGYPRLGICIGKKF